jgi:hypothetical protein
VPIHGTSIETPIAGAAIERKRAAKAGVDAKHTRALG